MTFFLRCTVLLLCAALSAVQLHAQAPKGEARWVEAMLPAAWITPFEASGGLRTPRYAETVAFCKRLAAASPLVHYTTFGVSAQGRQLPLLIVARGGAFDPAGARRAGKAVVLIQSGIHAGEIDGKDASLLLVRDIAMRSLHRELLDHAVLLFVPIFNVDGHERSGPFNRINQNGPEEMGWRVTAQNLNLNRDYMKADTPEMCAMLRLITGWLPDLLVDCHVTDGIDFQYDVTYTVETGPNIDQGIASWITRRLLPVALPAVEAAGHKIFPYVMPREDNDLSQGLTAGATSPRFSTGYAALQNRPAVLIETHMLKPYRQRVEATRAFLIGILEAVHRSAAELRQAVQAADRPIAQRSLPVRFGLGKGFTMQDFLGIEARAESSAVSGGMRTRYTGKPVTLHVPYYDQVTVQDSVEVPLGYAVPSEWSAVIERLRAHGVRGSLLRSGAQVKGSSYRFINVHFQERPFEGHHAVTFTAQTVEEERMLPPGTFIVSTAQRAWRVIVNLLEPRAPDALVRWGFFDAIFEQKEYAESYVMEAVADTLLRGHPDLRKEFEKQVHADSAFARDPGRRLNWLYLHSPWEDRNLNVYPVVRLNDPAVLTRLLRQVAR